MAAGGRLRRRRRLAVGAASAFAVGVLLIGGSQVARLAGGPPRVPDNPAQVANPPDGHVLGRIMPTGVKDGPAEWVIYAQPVARMRGERAQKNPLKLAKRGAMHYLARFAGNMNTLVRAQRPLQ